MSDQEFATIAAEDAVPRAGRHALVWALLLGAGLLAFELTAQPELAVVVACAKFGLEDFLTAVWLRRNDPDPQRARAYFWFYLASSFLRITGYAFVGLLLIALISGLLGLPAPQHAMSPAFLPFLIVLAASSTSAAVAWRGVWLARRGDLRIWVDPTIHHSRRARVWPPRPYGWNRVGTLLFATKMISAAVIPLMLLIASIVVLAPLARELPLAGGAVIALIPITLLSAIGMMIYFSENRSLENVLTAGDPAECWEPMDGTATRESGD